jgi:glucose/arabinose dehydrogenase
VQWIIGEWKMENVKDTKFKGTHREMLRLHAPTFAHGCQDIGFIPNLAKNDPNYGLLYFGYGDGGSNNIKRPELGHNLRSFLGTVMRIDPAGNNSKNGKYRIPPDNPFVNEKDPATVKEIYAYGFRNPHRLTWDPTNNNRLMVTDIGEANIEELNIIEKGADYGWPVMEGDFGITTTREMKKVYVVSKADLDRFKGPYLQYDHEEGNAISGGYVYEGELASLKNKYVFGDIVNGKLFYANIDRQLTDSTVYQLTIMNNGKETDLKEMCNTKRLHQRVSYDRYKKELYVITKANGKIWRIKKAYQ